MEASSSYAMLNAQNDKGRTPLHTAAADGRPIVKLIELGANVLAQDSNGRTPLHLASENGHSKTVNLLLETRANLLMRQRWTAELNLPEWSNYQEATNNLLRLRPQSNDNEDPTVLELIHSRLPKELFTPLYVNPSEESEEHGQLQQLHQLLLKAKVDTKSNEYQEFNSALRNGFHMGDRFQSDFRNLFVWDLINIDDFQRGMLSETVLGIAAWLLLSLQIVDKEDMAEQTALHRAACNGHLEVLEILLMRGAQITKQDARGQTALHLAASAGKDQVINMLLKNNTIKMFAENESKGSSPMAARIDNGKKSKVMIMRDLGLINLQDKSGQTALLRAIESKSLASANLLLLAARNPKPQSTGQTLQLELQRALQMAVGKEWQDGIELLSNHDTDLKTKLGQEALRLAANNSWETSIRTLSEHGVDLKTENGQKALQVVVKRKLKDTIRIMVHNGVEVQAEPGNEALQLAVEEEWEDIIKLLLDKRGKITSEDGKRLLPLALQKKEEVLRLVVQRTDVKTLDDLNMLWEAARTYDMSKVMVLVCKGANINAQHQGNTVLHLLAKREEWKTLHSIIGTEGVELNKMNEDGQTVLRQAVEHSNWETVRLLIENNAKADGEDGKLALFYAARAEKWNTVHLLRQRGLSFDLEDGQTLLKEAVEAKNEKSVVLLLGQGAMIDEKGNEAALTRAVTQGKWKTALDLF
ncbi:ankyrin repeat-containing domain protein [Trichoderma chlorosporum]